MTPTTTNSEPDDVGLISDDEVVRRLLDHIDRGTTFVGEATWREPVEHYADPDRLELELAVIRRAPVVVCPSAALPEVGSYLARDVAGVPLVAIRGNDEQVRVFRNACRHRGVQVAEGQGCKQALVCPYHGWSYGTDGSLRHVPHQHGFPDLELSTHGLVPVASADAGGLVFAGQDGTPTFPRLPAGLVPAEHTVLDYSETVVEANWKLFAESFLEGYHIRSTHRTTFYPLQYDNLNWIEFFGDHTRVAYPYRSIEKLRHTPLVDGTIDYSLTYVYHLFPNVIVATVPGRINVVVLEPESPRSTRMVSFWTGVAGTEPTRSASGEEKGPDYGAAQAEDLAMVTSAQRGLASGANEVLQFGLFESAIVRFHERLAAAVASVAEPSGVALDVN